MAKLIDGGRNKFSISILQKVISELHNLIDALAKVKQLRDTKAPGLLVVNRVESAEPDPAGFRDQVS
ncbi:hypothetical protein P8452_21786 [Trifolium repens]|nr:hypothetical protein P8452_21786 [Trifolium repens]